MLPSPLAILNKFGKSPLTATDFIKLCSTNDIEVVMATDVERGFYYCTDKKDTIVLSTKLGRADRRFVAYHEFAHFLQNFYRRKTIAAFSQVVPNDPKEKLADVFAMIAVNPSRIRITGPRDFIRMLMEEK